MPLRTDSRLTPNAAHVKASEVLRNGIDVVDTAIGVCRDNTVADRLKRYLRPLFLFEHTRFGDLAICNVCNRSLVCDDLAIIIVHGAGILEHYDFPTVFAAQPVLEVLNKSLRLKPCEYALMVDRVHVQ